MRKATGQPPRKKPIIIRAHWNGATHEWSGWITQW